MAKASDEDKNNDVAVIAELLINDLLLWSMVHRFPEYTGFSMLRIVLNDDHCVCK